MINNISFVTAHFYDFDWTNMLIRNIKLYTPPEIICEIVVINQDRTTESRNRLMAIDPQIRVLEYEKSDIHFNIMGHDHAAVLNKVLQEVKGEYLCIFDSDAHPINDKWLEKTEEIFEYFDAILALSPGQVFETHPCFMFIKKGTNELQISFDDGLFTHTKDTGRLVGKQLLNNGRRVFFSPPVRAFNGLYGFLYLDVIYHHQSASFLGSDDERLRSQIIWQNLFFKKFVINHNRYELSLIEHIKYKITRKMYRYLFQRPKSI